MLLWICNSLLWTLCHMSILPLSLLLLLLWLSICICVVYFVIVSVVLPIIINIYPHYDQKEWDIINDNIYIYIIDPIHTPFFLHENHLQIANWSLQGWWSSSHVRHWRCWELIGGRIPLMWAIFYREHMGKSWAYCQKPRNLGSKWWGTWWLTLPSSHESG